jgi:hypothetical protein
MATTLATRAVTAGYLQRLRQRVSIIPSRRLRDEVSLLWSVQLPQWTVRSYSDNGYMPEIIWVHDLSHATARRHVTRIEKHLKKLALYQPLHATCFRGKGLELEWKNWYVGLASVVQTKSPALNLAHQLMYCSIQSRFVPLSQLRDLWRLTTYLHEMGPS